MQLIGHRSVCCFVGNWVEGKTGFQVSFSAAVVFMLCVMHLVEWSNLAELQLPICFCDIPVGMD